MAGCESPHLGLAASVGGLAVRAPPFGGVGDRGFPGFAVTVVPWCAAGSSTVTGVATTRGDRDSNCDWGDRFRHSRHGFRNLVTVSALPSQCLHSRHSCRRLAAIIVIPSRFLRFHPVSVAPITVVGVMFVPGVVAAGWVVAAATTVTGVTTTRGDRDSNCDRGDRFRHSRRSHCHLVTVSALPSQCL